MSESINQTMQTCERSDKKTYVNKIVDKTGFACKKKGRTLGCSNSFEESVHQ